MFARRHFSLDEANLLLPRVAEHMARAMQLNLLVRVLIEMLERKGWRVTEPLLSRQVEPPWSMAKGEARQLWEAQGLYQVMMEELEAIAVLGGEVKGLEEGLVDFWSFLEGETEVLLCWRMGERTIGHYHLPEAGFGGRRRIGQALLSPAPRVPAPAQGSR